MQEGVLKIDAIEGSQARQQTAFGWSYCSWHRVPPLPGPAQAYRLTTSPLALPEPQPLCTLATFRPPVAHLLQNRSHPAPPQPSPSCGTRRGAPQLPTRRCHKTLPRTRPTTPVPSRSQRS